jgi:hypothetical protein
MLLNLLKNTENTDGRGSPAREPNLELEWPSDRGFRGSIATHRFETKIEYVVSINASPPMLAVKRSV